jgi:hypothetical protein
MADGDYERRGGREAELKRFHKILEQIKKSAAEKASKDAAKAV